MNRVLLADDDIELCEMLAEYLSGDGFEVDTAHDGDTALTKVCSRTYDLMVLDVMMPKMSGFDVLRALRMQSLIPVLMLTARGEDVDSIVGLELGADDYLAKPCNPRVLVARIRAILRRAEGGVAENERSGAPEILQVKDVEMHSGTRSVRCQGAPVALTSTEYNVLEILLREAGHVVQKNAISEHALGGQLTRYDRSLDMHVSNLRRKLGPLSNGLERIKTVRGTGYQYIQT